MKGLWLLIFGLVCGFLGAGLLRLVASPPQGLPIALLPPPTPQPVTVYVDGAVVRPGIYHLPSGSRVQDALLAAGGLSASAGKGQLNLAAILKDGERVFASLPSPTPAAAPLRSSAPTAAPRSVSPTPTRLASKINLNTATAQDLEALPGIGPVLAQNIIEYRQAQGGFKKIEEIMEVPGIGEKTFEKIKSFLSV